MPTTIEYANNPNEETAFVTPEGGQRTRAVLTTTVDGTVKFPDNPNSTKVSVTIDGVARKAVAVYNVAGGGDQHNLGYYATQAALEEAHATAEAGDWAIVGATDTVWIWDDDSSAWVDSDQKGQVTSVNNKTGAVTLAASDVGALANTATGYSSLTIGGNAAYNGRSTNVGIGSTASSGSSTAFGNNATCSGPYGIAIGASPVASKDYTIAIGNYARAEQIGSIQLGKGTNNETSTFCVGLVSDNAGTTVNYKLLDANGTIPTDRFTTTPSADGTYVPTLTISSGTPTRSWSAPSGGLPSQTGNAGKFLTTDGTDASWATISALQNIATGTNALTILGTATNYNYAINIGAETTASSNSTVIGGKAYGGVSSTAIGYSATTSTNGTALGFSATARDYCVAVGFEAKVSMNTTYCTVIGYQAQAGYYAKGSIQIGKGTNNDAGTMKVGLSTNGSTWNNYELLSSDGTIPTDRLTKANTTVTLAVADWSSSTQTVSVTGVTATSIVLVAPDSASQSDYTSAGILCTAQGAGTLTFTCSTTPTNAITVNVVAL